MLLEVRRTAMLALLVAATASPQQRTLPLDPLTAQERESATALARADARVHELLGSGRSRQIYVDFIAAKPARETYGSDQPPHRYADVLFYRYDGDLGVRALVDLQARAVTDVARVNGESVPINGEEIAEAGRLALADPGVARLFGGKIPAFRVATRPATKQETNDNRIEGLRTLGASPNDPCYRHRCIALFFRTNNRYVYLNRVVVDLTSQRVTVSGGEQ